MKIAIAAVVCVLSCSASDRAGAPDGGPGATGSDARAAGDGGVSDATAPGSAGTVVRYEAEAMTATAGAVRVGSAADRVVGDLGGEASQREAVTLATAQASLSFVVGAELDGANAIVVRYSIPDLATGGGATAHLAVTATATGGQSSTAILELTSRYEWLYGSAAAGTSLYNSPALASSNDHATAPTHLYDETQLLLKQPVAAGTTIALTLPPGQTTAVTIDFVELELVAPPLPQPTDLLAITDAQCGAVALDTRATGEAFDGADDSDYASVFHPITGSNPYNPPPGGAMEKDYYANASGDALQDNAANPVANGMTMFELADHNLASIQHCLSVASAANSGYAGIWIPPGRFYARGDLDVPDQMTIQGAGMWYSKLTAVDSAPPTTVTVGTGSDARTGIASVSGNLRFTSATGGTTGATLSDFAMFGNVSQRDTIDSKAPVGIIGEFSNSTLTRLWMEHYLQAIVLNQDSSHTVVSDVRARSTFADGIDFFGNTSNSTIDHCHSRNNGDDGFAFWSQSADSVSTGNQITNSVAELEWFGDGFGIYGGTDLTLGSNAAYDSLTGAGLKIGTIFVPTSLPASFNMSGVTVHDMKLYRCGGDGFDAAFGAVLIGPEAESITGLTLSNIDVFEPTYAAFDVRFLSNVGAVATRGAVVGLTITDSEVVGGSGCAQIGSGLGSSARLDGVCECDRFGGAAATCAIANGSPSTFAITADSCAAATCVAF